MASSNCSYSKCDDVFKTQQKKNIRKRKSYAESSSFLSIKSDAKNQTNKIEDLADCIAINRSSTPYPEDVCDHCKHEHAEVSNTFLKHK